MGSRHDCAVVNPQVTDSRLRRVKIVKVFEFIHLTNTPRQDSNLRSPLRRGMLFTVLTW
jgi:hypothetical protein